jgi:hypothetical protein
LSRWSAESYAEPVDCVVPELDYPDVSAGGRGFENIREFRPKVMAASRGLKGGHDDGVS